jgi:Rap guanine nucleotide exchange factor 2
LKNTWERIPQKWEGLFNDLQDLMDPSRNSSKYRNMFTGDRSYPPLIPWFPIVKKDITMLYLGNDTHIDGLVNFEKLRMISREVRKVCKYCNIGYDPYKMDALEENQGDANVALSVVSLSSNATDRRSGRGNLTMSNPKKAYEEFQTSRRIQHYLEKLSSCQPSEKELQEMSYNCEPPAQVSLPQGLPPKRPSPLPTTRVKESPKPSPKSDPPPALPPARTKEPPASKPQSLEPPPIHRPTSSQPSVSPSKTETSSSASASASGSGRRKHRSHDDRHSSSRNGSAKPHSSSSGSSRSSQAKKYKDIPALVKDGVDPKTIFDDDELHGQVSMV